MTNNRMKLVIDPGHGGKDPGAVNTALRLRESHVALAIAGAVRTLLEGVPNWKILMTRRDDRFVSLKDRTALANRAGVPLVSIHCNAASPAAKGAEVWCFAMTNAARRPSQGAQLARAIQKHLVRLGLKNRGVKAIFSRAKGRYIYRRLWMLRKTRRPAVIVECAFITNPKDARLLNDDPTGFRDRLALAIARGLFDHFTAGKAAT